MICKQCGEEFDWKDNKAMLKLWHPEVPRIFLPRNLCWDCLCDYIWNHHIKGFENIYDID